MLVEERVESETDPSVGDCPLSTLPVTPIWKGHQGPLHFPHSPVYSDPRVFVHLVDFVSNTFELCVGWLGEGAGRVQQVGQGLGVGEVEVFTAQTTSALGHIVASANVWRWDESADVAGDGRVNL